MTKCILKVCLPVTTGGTMDSYHGHCGTDDDEGTAILAESLQGELSFSASNPWAHVIYPNSCDPTTYPRPRMFNTFRPCATNFKTSIVTDFDIVNHPLARSIVVWWHQVLTEHHSSFHIYAHGPL